MYEGVDAVELLNKMMDAINYMEMKMEEGLDIEGR